MKTTKQKTSLKRPAVLATSIAALVTLSLAGFAPKAAGATQYWDGGSPIVPVSNGVIDGGSGTWDNTTFVNWTNSTGTANSTYAGGSTQAVFQGTAGTVVINTGNVISFGEMDFVTSGYIINSGGAGGVLALNNATNTIVVTSPGTATINAQIVNGAVGGLTVGNAGVTGTLILTNTANNYAGGTILNGTATLLNNAATSTLGLGAVTINGNNATFGTSFAGAVSISNDININNGAGSNLFLTTANGNTLTLNNINLQSTGKITGATAGGTGANTILIGATIAGGTNGVTYESSVFGGTTFQYDLHEVSNYTGLTVVQNGATLVLNNNTVNSAIKGDLTINNAGIVRLLQPGGEQIANSSTVTVNTGGTFDLNNQQETIATLNSGANGGSVTLGTGTLTVKNGSFSGNLSGTGGSLTKNGLAADVLTLGGTNTYTGTTTINFGTIKAGSVSALSAGSAFNLTGVSSALDLGGFNNQISSLVGVAGSSVTNSGAATAVLTFGNAVTPLTFAGNLTDGAGKLGITKVGTGAEFLSGVNAYSGPTTVTVGTLVAGSTTAFSPTSALILNGSSTSGIQLLGFNNTVLSISDGGTTGGTVLNGAAAGTAVLTFGDSTNTRFLGAFSDGGAGGTLGITKQGTGTTIIGNALNTYTGATTINGGTLQAAVGTQAFGVGSNVTLNNAGSTLALAGFSNTIGSLAGGAGTIVTNSAVGAATLTVGNALNTVFAGVLQNGAGGGTLSLTKVGADTLKLSGANTYTGATTISNGILQMGAANALATGTAVTVASGATFDLNGNNGFNQSIGSLAGLGPTTASVLLGNATLTTGSDNTNTEFDGVISQTGVLVKVGTGTFTLGGGAGGNSYSGGTMVNNGVLALNETIGVALGTGPLVIGDGIGAAQSAVVRDLNSSDIGGQVSVTINSDGLLDIGAHTETIGSLTGVTGAQVAVGATGLLTLGNSTNTNYAGGISGAGGIIKTGSGIQTFSGLDNYTGTTTVSIGTLAAGSTTAFAAQSAFTVTGTLDLNGFSNSIGSLAGAGIVKDTGATAATLTITGNNGAPVTFSGKLIDDGPLSLVKNGAGTQILSGGGVNTYSGSTTVNGGILQAGAINAFSPNSATFVNTGGTLDLAMFNNTILSLTDSGAPGGTIQTTGGAATLTFGDANSLTFHGNITTALSLVKNGSGVETLAGVNTYTGTTTINAGGIKAGSATAFGTGSNFNLNSNTATLDLGGFSNTIGTLTGLGGSTVQNSTATAATLTTGAAASSTFNGNIVNGAGAALGLTKVLAGSLTLTGNDTYTGLTTINGGALIAGSTTAFSAGSAVQVNTGGTLTLNGFNNTILSLSDAGTGNTGIVQDASGTNATLTFGDANNLAYHGTIVNGAGGGTLALVKNGGGTETFTGANTYTGSTTINAGRLVAGVATVAGTSGAFGVNSAVNITASGGTLDLGGFANTIGSLTGVAGSIVTDSVNAATLTTGTLNQNSAFAGNLVDGPGAILSLTKTGTGIQTLSGNNTYSGTTTIGNAAATSTLLAGSTTALSAASAFQINANGLLDLGGFNNTILSLSGLVGSAIQNSGVPNAILTFGNSAANTFAGNIVVGPLGSGTLGITKNGTGTETLSGTNTYTGPTTINAGALLAGSTAAFGNNSKVNITAVGATLDIGGNNNSIGDLTGVALSLVQSSGGSGVLTTGATGASTTFAGILQNGGGTLGLTKVGAGTMTVSGLNTYTGVTTVNGGTLLAGSTQAFGVNSAVTVNLGGTLDLGGNSNTIGSLNGTAGGIVQNSTATPATLTISGTAAGNYAGNIINGAGGVLSLTKIGAGVQTLAGNDTYTGVTTINGGSLVAGSTTGLSSTSAFLVNTGGTLAVNGFNSTILSLSDAGLGNTGTVQNGAAGNAVLTFGDATPSLTFHGVIQNGGAGTLGITKVGTGTEILTGASTYTGATTITSGLLQVDGSLGATAVTVQSGATLGGIGSIAGTVTVANGGHLAPGDSPGTITVGNLVLNSGSLLDYQLGTPGVVTPTAPFTSDLTIVTSNLTLDGTLNVTDAGGFGPGSYRIFNYGGTLTDNTLNVAAVPGGYTTYVATNITGQVNLIVLAGPGAGSQYWDGPNTTANGIVDGGTGTWTNNNNSNWTNSVGSVNSNWTNGTAVFQGTAGTVTLGDNINFQGLVFNTGGYTINPGAAPFRLLADGAVTITTALSATPTTINAVIADSILAPGTPGSVRTQGGGTLILTAANTYSGGTTITGGGTVSVQFLANGGAASGIGASSSAAANLVLDGGTLQYTGAATSTDRLFSVSTNGGVLDASGTGAVNFTNTGAMGFNAQVGARTLVLTGTNTGNNTLAAAIGDNGGATSLVKNGAGTWVLSGTNNYSGSTTVNAGTLKAGSVTGLSASSAFLVNGGGTLDVNGFVSTILSLSDNGVGPVFGTVTNNGALASVLTFGDINNLTFHGNIVNGVSALGITKQGTGTEILSGNNTYTGPTTVNAGTLQAGSTTAFGSNSVVAVNLGGTLDLGGFSNTIAALTSGVTGGTVKNSGAIAATLTISGTTGLPATFAGNIVNTPGAGALSLTKNGAGTQTLSGNDNYTGVTTIGGGTLMAGSTTAFSAASAVNITVAGAGTGLDLGGFSNSIGSLQGVVNSIVTTTNGPATLTTGNDGINATFAGNLINGTPAPGIDILSLTKVGAGKQTLSGNNTYTGATNVNAGALVAGSTTGFSVTSAFLVNTGGTLDLNGFSNTVLSLTDTGAPGGIIQNGGAANAVLTFGDSNNLTFHGNIIAGPGAGTLGITKQGTGTETLTGVNNYTGPTVINNGRLLAGSTTAFGVGSAVNVGALGTLDLGTFNNSIGNLSGSGIVKNTGVGAATLTITNPNGSNFSGKMLDDGPLGLTLNGPGTQILSGISTYSGDTNINGPGAILQAGSVTGFSPNSKFFVNTGGTLDLNGFSNTILALTDTGTPGGTVTTTGGAATLTFGDANSLTFHGNITGAALGITKQGSGIETLTGNNTYGGATQVNAGGLLAGSTTAFSANSAYTLNNGTSLDLGGFNNSVGSLAGLAGSTVRNSTATAATLTEGGLGTSTAFAGNIIDGAGAPLSLTKVGAGTLTLSGNDTYTGKTTINAGGITAGSATALSAGSAFLVNTGGTLSVNGWNSTILSLADNGAPGGTVQNGAATNAVLTFGDANSLTFNGVIQNGGAGTLGITKNGAGAETLKGVNTYTGPTTVNVGKLIGGSTSAFGVNSATTVAGGATLDLGGFNNTLGSLAGAGSVTDSVNAATLTVGTLNQNTTFSGNIFDGPGAVLSLTKVGTGIQTLSGNNTYSGATIISAGEILAGSTTALSMNSAFNLNTSGAILDLGGFSNTVASIAGVAGTTLRTVAGPATLTFGGDNTNTTFAGLITNSVGSNLSLVKNGNGTFTVTGANTYTGTTTLNSGGLNVNNNTALGTGSLIVNNAGAGSTLGSTVGGITFANATQINGDFSVAPTGTLTDSGAVTLNGTHTITGTNANTFNFAGAIGEAAAGTGVTFTTSLANPASIFQYSGVAANTYTGLTTVQGNATLQLNKTAGVDAIGTGGLTVGNTATVTLLANEQINNAATVLLNNTATFNVNGFNETITTLNTDAGTGTTVQLGAGTLTVNNGTVNGVIVGAGGNLTKNGAPGDALTLTNNANSYSGTTTLNSGILNINANGALGTSALVINGGFLGNTDLANVSHTFANAITVQGSFDVNGPQQLISSGPVSLAIPNTTINTDAGGLDFSGVISQVMPVSNLTFTGATNTTFSGGGSNTYTGLTDVEGGILTLAKTGATAIAGNLNIANGATAQYSTAGGVTNNQIAPTSNVNVNGTLNLNGHEQTISALTGSGGVRLGNAALTSGKLVVGSGFFSGNISDNGPSGQLVKNTGGVLTLTGNNTLTGQTSVQAGSLFLDGSVGGNVAVFANGFLGGNGVVGGSLSNSGVVSPGHSPGVLTVKGGFQQFPSGILHIEIAGLAGNQHDLLAVGGPASLGGTVQIVPLNNFVLERHDKVVFLTANQVNGTFSTEAVGIATDSKFLKATVLYEPNDVALVAQQLAFGSVLKGLTPNQKAVAWDLDGALNDPRLDKAIGYLDAAPFGKVPHLLDEIAPEELASIYTIGISQANVQSANLERRMDDIRSGTHGFSASGFSVSGGMSQYSGNFSSTPSELAGLSGPDGKNGKELRPPTQDTNLGVFVTGVGEFTHVGDTYNASGYDLATGGFTLGVDYRIGEHFAVGVNAGYARTNADLIGGGHVNVDGGKIGVYGTFFDGGFYADVSAQGGYNNYDTRRAALAGAATGSTSGGELNALFNTGYDFKSGGLTVGPTASVQYTYVGFRGFTETGSLLPLNLRDQHGESLRSSVGMKASYDWQIGGVTVRPEVRAAWQHEFESTAFAIDSSFANGAGNTFTVHGAETGRDSVLIGAGVAVLWNERTSTYVYYDGEIGRTNYDSHNVSGGVRMSF